MDTHSPARIFPSATTARFLVLLTLFIIVSFTYGIWFALDLAGGFLDTSSQIEAGLISVALAIVTACLIFLAHPLTKVRSFGHTVPLSEGPVKQRVQELCRMADVRLPYILMDGDIRNADAIVFGLPFLPTLVLGRRFLLLELKKPNEFDARVLHELGHIKYRDATIALFSQAILWVVGSLFVLIFLGRIRVLANVVAADWDRSWASPSATWINITSSYGEYILIYILNYSVIYVPHCIFWMTIIVIEFKAILRSREAYADNFSRNIVGSDAIFATISDQIRLGSVSSRWDLFRNHPNRESRLTLIVRPFLVGLPDRLHFFWVAFVGGAVTAASYRVVDIAGAGGPLETMHLKVDINDLMNSDPELMPYIVGLILALTIVIFPYIVALMFMIARFCSDLVQRPHEICYMLKRMAGVSVALSFGYWLGFVVYPGNVNSVVNGTVITVSSSVNIGELFSALTGIIIWYIILVVAALISIIAARRNVVHKLNGMLWTLVSIGFAVIYLALASIQGQVQNTILSRSALNPTMIHSSFLTALFGLSIPFFVILTTGRLGPMLLNLRNRIVRRS